MPCPLREAAVASPGAPAIVGPGGKISYRELDLRVTSAAEVLGEMGLSDGVRVALHGPKDRRYLVALLALIRAGAVACPVSTRVPPQAVPPLLEKAGCRALISDTDEPAETAGVKTLGWDALPGDEPARAVPPSGPPSGPSPGPLSVPLDRPATVVFTSGSTGAPKAALHTFGNHYLSAEGSNANIDLAPGDRWLHSLPIYHVGGLSVVFRCLMAGATISLPDPQSPLTEAVAASGATHVSVVATQLRRLLRDGAGSVGYLKAVLLGGGPVPIPLVQEAAARGLPVHASYGLTEMASQVTTTPPGAAPDELRTSGRVLPHREVSVAEDGGILVRGGTLFAGYAEGEAVDLPLDAGGWFATGDLGEMDANGFLRVTGRRDNMFVSGGENVQPEEIEAALRALGGVEDAVAVPVPDDEFGGRPAAFVRTTADAPTDLAGALEPVLPRFKIPVAFYQWPGQHEEGMKPDRYALAERARRLRRVTGG